MKPSFLQIKDETIIFTGKYMEAYIPDKLFKKNLNEVYGDKINMMGIFNFRLSDTTEIDPKSKLYTFNFPSMITSKPGSIETKQMELTKDSGLQTYYVLKYNTGDPVLTSTNVIMDISNVEKFVNLLMSAALPNTLEYETVLKMFYKNLEINNETCNVSSPALSTVVSELYRYKKDNSIPFRRAKGVKGTDYTPANARSVCANTSTFTALTFEDINTMLVYSVNRKRSNKKQTESPLEQIIKV